MGRSSAPPGTGSLARAGPSTRPVAALATAAPTLTRRATLGARTLSAGSSTRPMRPAGPASWIIAASVHTAAR